MNRVKLFIFSDESGSWHDPNDIYVRSWLVIEENEYQNKLILKVDEIASIIETNELKWTVFVHHPNFFKSFNNINFRIFITISSPKDIAWNTKYRLTRNFETNIQNFDFGELDEYITSYIKERVYRDLQNALFLHFYERYHIENAKNGIERVIKPKDFDLIYRIDPPQMSKEGWRNVVRDVSKSPNINIEFPKSNRAQGIQFADVIAGCFRSLVLMDDKFEQSKQFLSEVKGRLIAKDQKNPNPNLIFYNEINDEIKVRCGNIWTY